MLGRIRDNKYIKCVGNKTNPKDDISLLLHKDGNLIILLQTRHVQ